MATLAAGGDVLRAIRDFDQHQQRDCDIVELLRPCNGVVGEAEALRILQVLDSGAGESARGRCGCARGAAIICRR